MTNRPLHSPMTHKYSIQDCLTQSYEGPNPSKSFYPIPHEISFHPGMGYITDCWPGLLPFQWKDWFSPSLRCHGNWAIMLGCVLPVRESTYEWLMRVSVCQVPHERTSRRLHWSRWATCASGCWKTTRRRSERSTNRSSTQNLQVIEKSEICWKLHVCL